jgi:hypothetical protein
VGERPSVRASVPPLKPTTSQSRARNPRTSPRKPGKQMRRGAGFIYTNVAIVCVLFCIISVRVQCWVLLLRGPEAVALVTTHMGVWVVSG